MGSKSCIEEITDLISRQAAIDALWKALYEYEDVTEKQFIKSEELDVGDWFQHRIFVQNMSDIDRQTILALPSVQPEIIQCRNCKYQDKGSNDSESMKALPSAQPECKKGKWTVYEGKIVQYLECPSCGTCLYILSN